MNPVVPIIILLLFLQFLHFLYKYGANTSFRTSLCLLGVGVMVGVIGVGSGDSHTRRRIVPTWWRRSNGEADSENGPKSVEILAGKVQSLLPRWATVSKLQPDEPTSFLTSNLYSPPSTPQSSSSTGPATLSDIQEQFEASLESVFFGVSSNWRVLTAKIAEMADGPRDDTETRSVSTEEEEEEEEEKEEEDEEAVPNVGEGVGTSSVDDRSYDGGSDDSLPWYLLQQCSRYMWATAVFLVRINVAVGVLGVIFYTVAPQPIIERAEDTAMTLLSRVAVTVVAWLTRHQPDMMGRIEVELIVED